MKGTCTMAGLDLETMMDLQDELQEKYRGKWEPIQPDRSYFKLLWMIEEIGEVVALLKKRGETAVMEDPAIRSHFLEEMSDVLMYYVDTLECLNVTPEEFSEAYLKKHDRNMGRDFVKEHSNYLK